MTRRLLLAAGGAPVGAIPDPIPDIEPPESIWAGWPTSTDPTLLALRPHGRRAGHASVGVAGATNVDLNQAAIDAKAEAELDGGTGSLYWDGVGPDYRYDVIIGAGTYEGSMGAGNWGAYVGATGNPADVIIQGDDNGGGVVHSFGSQYLEGITLRAYTTDADTSPKYPWHITGGQMAVAARCVFDASTAHPANAGGATSGLIGKDGQAGMSAIFYDSTFIGRDGIRGFNMHGGDAGDHPETIAFINCHTVGVTSIGGTGNRDINGNPSRLYVIGLTGDEMLESIGADINTEVYTDSDLPVIGTPAAVYRNVTTWPTPTDGLSDAWASYYYPSAIGAEPHDYTPPVTDAAAMTVTAGRTYYTRIDPDTAMRITHSGFTCVAAVGTYAQLHRPVDNPYERNRGPESEDDTLSPSNALTVGVNVNPFQYFYTRYPGDNGVWHKCEFSSGSAQILGSADLPGVTDCYYSDNDGATLVPVTAGTPHPLPFIRATA